MTEVYYIEDDKHIAQTVNEYLAGKNCMVSVCSTIAEAEQALEHHVPEVVLVDWNMPDGQGGALCRMIRERWKSLPVIFITARDDPRDMVFGFQQGADDYIVKPFELEVLYSRICAVLRRTGNGTEPSLTCGSVRIDQSRMMVFCGYEEISLSQAEYQLLLLLMINKGKTMTRERLLEQIWDYHGNYVNDNTLTVTMKRLREKLHQPPCLKTIRSFGYRMEETV